MLKRLGATCPGVWFIKHVIAPADRRLYRWTGGRISLSGRAGGPILLLTTTGRRTGEPRTTPVFYLRDGPRLVLCNVNPGFEKTNPWVLNLRAHPVATVQIGSATLRCDAREATPDEVEAYWPRLVRMWPPYQSHFERSGLRAVFILECRP
jgi:deazaflavin-dependent oxidoreductase (nitroreductase family)